MRNLWILLTIMAGLFLGHWPTAQAQETRNFGLSFQTGIAGSPEGYVPFQLALDVGTTYFIGETRQGLRVDLNGSAGYGFGPLVDVVDLLGSTTGVVSNQYLRADVALGVLYQFNWDIITLATGLQVRQQLWAQHRIPFSLAFVGDLGDWFGVNYLRPRAVQLPLELGLRFSDRWLLYWRVDLGLTNHLVGLSELREPENHILVGLRVFLRDK